MKHKKTHPPKADQPLAGDKSKDQNQSQQQVEAPCGKCTEAIEGWKRALADYDNLQKDLAQERGRMRQSTREDVIQSLLPVLDNFDQAVKFVPKNVDGELKGWLQGILHVQNQLEEVLRELGAESFGQVSDKFDPELHEAVAEGSQAEQGDQTILEINQRGWKIGEKIIRPAKVIVNNLN
ncbi:nucleotide exchange factor GrpE [Patescibacteria group bacterium]